MATIKDISERAGVSPGAVSRILSNDSTLSVTEATRNKVLRAAKELNYEKKKPNKAAYKIGIVQWFSAEDEMRDNYYLTVRKGIEDYCDKHYIKVAKVYRTDAGFEKSLSSVNGLICIGKFSKDEIEEFKKICANVIFLDMHVDDDEVTSLCLDFTRAVNEALDYLVELGHKKISLLIGQEYVGDNEPLTDQRKIAFENYMNRNEEMSSKICVGSFSTASGYSMMKELIDNNEVPTAVFAASDAIAVGAMKAIKEVGLRIPEDISLLGFNDGEISAYTTPALTTIHAPAYDMGQHGANLICAATNLSIRTPLRAEVPCYLVKRESCGHPPATRRSARV